MNHIGVLNLNDEIYFAPLKYLIDYAELHHQSIMTLMTKHHVPKLTQKHILKMHPLNQTDLKYLTLMTHVSETTWRNLDNDWQAGQIKYQSQRLTIKKD